MRRLKRITAVAGACFIILFGCGVARAGDSPATPLSLKQCIDIALTNQSDVLIGQNGVAGAKAGETSAKSDYYPQISVQRSVSHADSNEGVRNQDSGSIGATQNIYDGGLREMKVGAAHAATARSEFGLVRLRQTAVFNVTQDYFRLLQAMRLFAVKTEQVKYLESQVEMIKTQIQLGAAAEVDSLPIEAQLANARVDVISAKNAVQNSAVQIQNTMGLSPQLDFTIQEDDTTPEFTIQPADKYIETALQSRPEIQQSNASITSAKYSVKSAKISLLPVPNVSADYGEGFISGGQHTFTITGGFVYDVFDGGRNRSTYKTAKTNLSTAQINAVQTQKDIRTQVQQAWLNLESAKERMAASDLSLASAQKNYEVQQNRYKQGLAIPLDILNAELAVVTASSSAVQSRYDFFTAIAQLEYATGVQGVLYETK